MERLEKLSGYQVVRLSKGVKGKVGLVRYGISGIKGSDPETKKTAGCPAVLF